MQGPSHLDLATATHAANGEAIAASYRRRAHRSEHRTINRLRSHLGNGLIRTGQRVAPKPSERLRTAGPPC
jgi:hypothetical protein